MERLCLRQNLPGLQASKDTYNKLFFLNTHSIDATVQVYADADRSSKGATQFINHLQCRICEKVFHKAFGLEFHLNHEHDANEKPKKKFDVKTFITKTSSARHKKAKSKKSKKKSNQNWDLENAWRDDDSDETDGEVVYDDESDLDVLEPDDDLDDIEVVESSPAGKKKSGPPKTIIDTFDAETAAVLSGFKELQPTVYIRDIRHFPDAAGGIDLPPLAQEEAAVQSPPKCDGNNETSVVSFDSEPADPSTILDGLEDCADMWEEPGETEEERALMQQLEDVIARPTSAPIKVVASREEVTRDITVKVMDERGTRDVAAEVTHKVTPQKGDTKQVEADSVTSVMKSQQSSLVTPLKVTRGSHGGSYKVSKDKSKGDEGKVKRTADSENDVVNLDTPTPKKYKPSPASKKKKTSKPSSEVPPEDVVDILDTTFDQLTPASTSENKNYNSESPPEDVVDVLDTTLDQPCSDKKSGSTSPPSKVAEEVVEVMDTTVDIEVDDQPTENVSPAAVEDTDSKIVNTGGDKAEAIPFVCCKFVTVESTDDEGDEAVDVVNVDTTPTKTSPVKKSKPAAASPAPQPPKKKSPSIKHIALTKKKIEELKTTEPGPPLSIKKDIGSPPPPQAVSKRRNKAPPVTKDDSDSDIEIIMSPTAPKKKTFVPTTKEEQKLVQIRQMIQRQSAAIETEKKLRRSQFIGDDDLDSSDELNGGPNAWQSSPRKKQKCQRPAAVVKEQSLGTPSHYSSSGTVSPMEMGTPLKPLGLDAEKQLVAKRRLFTNTPTKVQPKKARNATTFRPTPASKDDDDDDLICLD